jgi:hypothetical protein
MIRTITRVCLATAAVLLLAAPTKAAYLRRAQAVATEGKSRSVWVGGGNENKGGSDKAGLLLLRCSTPRAEPARCKAPLTPRSIQATHTHSRHPAHTHTTHKHYRGRARGGR